MLHNLVFLIIISLAVDRFLKFKPLDKFPAKLTSIMTNLLRYSSRFFSQHVFVKFMNILINIDNAAVLFDKLVLTLVAYTTKR